MGRRLASHALPLERGLGVVLLSILTAFTLVYCTGTETSPFDVDDGDDAVDSSDATDIQVDPSSDTPTDAAEDGLDFDGVDVADAADTTDTGGADAGALSGSGTWDDPYIIVVFPFEHAANTLEASADSVDVYACAPDTNESGPEVVYRLTAPLDGILAVAVDDTGAGVDVDVHLLDADDAASCRVRNNTRFWDVVFDSEPLWLAVDTFVNNAGIEQAGPYVLSVDLDPLPGGDCALEQAAIEMFNREEPLMLPAIGEVVREAHLVTTEEFPDTWPTSSRDGIDAHYALTEAASGYVMDRNQSWAPEGEGGSEWGQGSTSRPPPLDETWYVNMYWRNRPDRGTRMLVLNPEDGSAVVTAAGYETGPGSALRIGGATEEVLHALDSTHRSRLLMGFLVDQTLAFGPIDCRR